MEVFIFVGIWWLVLIFLADDIFLSLVFAAVIYSFVSDIDVDIDVETKVVSEETTLESTTESSPKPSRGLNSTVDGEDVTVPKVLKGLEDRLTEIIKSPEEAVVEIVKPKESVGIDTSKLKRQYINNSIRSPAKMTIGKAEDGEMLGCVEAGDCHRMKDEVVLKKHTDGSVWGCVVGEYCYRIEQ